MSRRCQRTRFPPADHDGGERAPCQRVDPDDGIDELCQTRHWPGSFLKARVNVGTALDGTTERHICDGSRHRRTGF